MTPYRRYTILFICWMGWVFDIADTALFNYGKGPMLIQMMGSAAYRSVGPRIEANIQSCFLLGWSLGGLVFGILADRWGRSKTLLCTVLIYSGFTALTALCKSPEQVAATRFFAALGIGGEWAAGASLIAESFPDAQRPMAASILQTAAAFGPAFVAGVSLALADRPWQWLFLVGIAPTLMCVFARSVVLETPQTGTSGKTTAQGVAPDPFRVRPARKRLYWTRLYRTVSAAMVVGAVGIAGAQTATFWMPNLVRAASSGLTSSQIVARTANLGLVSQIGTLAGVFVAPWLSQRIGRKATIGVFFAAAPLAVAIATHGPPSFVRLLTTMPLVNLFAIGIASVFALYFPELFPSSFRATGAGLAYNVGRFLTIPMPLFTAWAMSKFGGSPVAGSAGSSAGSGVLLSSGVYLIGLAALPFLPETLGKPLPE